MSRNITIIKGKGKGRPKLQEKNKLVRVVVYVYPEQVSEVENFAFCLKKLRGEKIRFGSELKKEIEASKSNMMMLNNKDFDFYST